MELPDPEQYQAGNVLEWTEGLLPPLLRCLWGGSLAASDASQAYFGHRGDWGPLIMAWSSLTVGGCGIFHWIRNASCPDIRRNVARL